MPNLLKVRLSLKGRPIRTYVFDKPAVSIGRDPAADIFLDNTGISRDHALIERTPGGYVLSDRGSANGTFLNEQPVQKKYLSANDVVQIGKFALWMEIESSRRAASLGVPPGADALEGTMILEPDSLLDMQRKSSVEITETPPSPARAERTTRFRDALVLAAVFLGGAAFGWALSLLGGP